MDFQERSKYNAAKTRFSRLFGVKWFDAVLAQKDLELKYRASDRVIEFTFNDTNSILFDLNELQTKINGMLIGPRDSIRNHFKKILLSDEELFINKEIIHSRKMIAKQFIKIITENESALVTFNPTNKNHDLSIYIGDNWVDNPINIFIDYEKLTFLIDESPIEREYMLERIMLRVSLYNKFMNR